MDRMNALSPLGTLPSRPHPVGPIGRASTPAGPLPALLALWRVLRAQINGRRPANGPVRTGHGALLGPYRDFGLPALCQGLLQRHAAPEGTRRPRLILGIAHDVPEVVRADPVILGHLLDRLIGHALACRPTSVRIAVRRDAAFCQPWHLRFEVFAEHPGASDAPAADVHAWQALAAELGGRLRIGSTGTDELRLRFTALVEAPLGRCGQRLGTAAVAASVPPPRSDK